jgi:long-subunit acyl-CoA synthetase (AMP-forming)
MQSLCHHFQQRVAERGDEAAIRRADGSVALTWAEYGRQVRRIAAGLSALGVGRGDAVGLMLTNRPEFHVVDAAVMHLGGAGFSIYNTSAAPQITYLLDNAQPRVIVTGSQFLARVRQALAGSAVEHVVCVDDAGPDLLTLSDVADRGAADFDFDAQWRGLGRDDLLTLIYTSGTTGNPKGVELTHGNLLHQLEVIASVVGDLTHGRVLSYLPDAHLINRWIGQYAPMYFGITVTDVDDPKTLVDVLARVRPTFFVAVPMLWYKIKARVEQLVAERRGAQGAVVRWALAVGGRSAAAKVAGRRLSPLEQALEKVADAVVLSKIRAQLGMDDLVAAVSGAAPIDVKVLEFMLAIGVPVLEAWGMSETSAVTTVNPKDAPKYGSVGRPVPGVEIALRDDGEILVRGGGVMRGYRNDPVRTADVLDGDGWIHTGDIGTLDDRGYLSIVDRKKELIINSGGKNMSPSNIEGALKAASPLVGSVAAIGDNRPHVAALITLDADAVAALARRLEIADSRPEVMANHPAVHDGITQAVAEANSRLSRVEHIRTWKVLPLYWVPGGDELTPTLKLKRVPIAKKYAADIDALYQR